MLDVKQFKELIIAPTLEKIGLYSETATNLLLGTALAESGLCYLIQTGNGPGRGLYQIENICYTDIVQHVQRPAYKALYQRIMSTLHMTSFPQTVDSCIGNLVLATIIARLVYYFDRRPLPADPNDATALGDLWRLAYNRGGKATTDRFVALYSRFCEHL